MTIEEELRIIGITTQQDLCVEAPAECAELFAQAQRDGIAVNRLYTVRAPLSARKLGSYVRDGASIWILYAQEGAESLEQALRCELYALAQAEANAWSFATIDEDWDEVSRLWKRASELAQRWGWGRLFPAAFLERRQKEVEELREYHWYAGYLAGSLAPSIARASFDALCDVRERERWSAHEFGEALAGVSELGSRNGLVLDLDRCLLSRRSWRQPYRRQNSFGALALSPALRSDRLLRSALSFCAEHPVATTQLCWQRFRHEGAFLCFQQVEDEQDLAAAIGALNALLLEETRESVLALWDCYGESSRSAVPPLYRLALSYGGTADEGDRLTREVWTLFPSRHARHVAFEGALQRYIASWGAWTSFEYEGARDGLSMLWSWLK